MECPNCKTISISGSGRCACGYNLDGGGTSPVKTATPAQPGRRWWWIGLVVLGKVVMRACKDEDQRR